MTHVLTRAKAAENAAFLRRLEATANVRLAATEAGLSYCTMQRRRAAHPGFAQAWDAALVVAQARLRVGGYGGDNRRPAKPRGPDRTQGGEVVLVRRRDGTVQVRRAQAGRLNAVAEQRFLLALSATCNVRLAAAAVGTQTTHFYRRRRENPAFAREMKAALERGYEALQMALLASWSPASREHDGWQHNDPPPVPAMTANQALQLLYLHQKEARYHAERADMKPRRGEPGAVRSARLARQYLTRLAEEAEHALLAKVLKNSDDRYVHDTPPIPPLPALDQVKGWSRADQNAMHVDGGRALFGGFRVEHLTQGQRARGRQRSRQKP